MERVRLSADVDPELRRQVRIAAAKAERKVSDWIAEAVTRQLERQEAEEENISRASGPAFARDWNSEDDAGYDELAG